MTRHRGNHQRSFRLFWGVFLLLGGVWLGVAGAAPPEPGRAPQELPLTEPLDFDACARLAIRQSPFLTKSDLEIQLRRLDEADSKSDFTPSVNFRTRYYVTDLSRTGLNNSPYSLEFVSEPYSPIEAYFSLQVRKLITKIAVLNHLQAISEGLHRLGRLFLEMEGMRQLIQVQNELVQVAEKNLLLAQEKITIGTGDLLELKVATQEVEVARASHKQLVAAQQKNKESVRAYLAWPASQEFRLELARSRPQILGEPEKFPASEPAPPNASFDLKIQAIRKELQKYNVSLAKTKLLPTFFLGMETPDPLSAVQSRSLFFYVGASIPVWDGFKRLRNISRQKVILKQFEAQTGEKEIDFQEKWREAHNNATEAAAQLRLSQSQLELALLKQKQQEIRYHKLGEPLAGYLEGEKGVFEARKNVLAKTLEYDLARLNLRHLANTLISRYVNEHSLPFRPDAKY